MMNINADMDGKSGRTAGRHHYFAGLQEIPGDVPSEFIRMSCTREVRAENAYMGLSISASMITVIA